MTIKAVLFDKDGTLINFDATFAPATARVLNDLAAGDPDLTGQMAEAVQFDLVTHTIAPGSVLIAGSLENISECLMPLGEGTEFSAFNTRVDQLYIKYSMETLAPFDYLVPTLDALEDMGLPLGVATNDSENAALAHLNQLEVSARFCFIAGYDSGHGEKPAPGMVSAFAEYLQIAPNELMMVGDSSHDCIAGRAAGALAIAVASGGAEAEELEPHADHVLPNIGGLPELIARLNKETAA